MCVFPQSALIIFRPIQHVSFPLCAGVSFVSTVASISTPVLFFSADCRFKGRDTSGLVYLWITCDYPTPPALHSESRPPAAVFKCVKTSTENGGQWVSDSETSRLLSKVNDFQLSGSMSPWPPGPSFRVQTTCIVRYGPGV